MKMIKMMIMMLVIGSVGCMSPYTVEQEEEALVEGDGSLPDDGYIQMWDMDADDDGVLNADDLCPTPGIPECHGCRIRPGTNTECEYPHTN